MSSPLEGLPESLTIESAREAAAAKEREKDEIGQADFLRMLVAQLENQDPLNPQDSTEFTAQLATFSSLEQQISMRTSLDQLVEGQNAVNSNTENLQLASMIGRDVMAVGDQLDVPAGSNREVPILYGLEAAAERVEVEIQDANGNVVAHLDQRNVRAGANELVWNGRSSGGAEVPPGTYRFEVSAYSGSDAEEADVASEPVIAGRVTGTLFDESGSLLRLGDRLVSFRDVFEVREGVVTP